MNINLNEFLSDQALVVGDVHIGVRSDADKWHTNVINYANWLSEQAKTNGIKTIIFLGDFFHNRLQISQACLNTAESFMTILKDYKKIFIIGNHDCYYRDNASIHSLAPFSGWENVAIVDKIQTVEYNGKKFSFAPWGFVLDEIPDNNDYLFGHFEINSFGHTIYKICQTGISSTAILAKGKHVYSGHYHKHSERGYNEGKEIIYVGNIYQQDWGDYEDQKGIYLVDFVNETKKFIENTVSPVHLRYTLDELSMCIDSEKIKNNIIKVIAETDCDKTILNTIGANVSMHQPFELVVEFENKSVRIKSIDEIDTVAIDLKTILEEFIKNLDIGDEKAMVLTETLELYEKAVNKMKGE